MTIIHGFTSFNTNKAVPRIAPSLTVTPGADKGPRNTKAREVRQGRLGNTGLNAESELGSALSAHFAIVEILANFGGKFRRRMMRLEAAVPAPATLQRFAKTGERWQFKRLPWTEIVT